MDVELAVSLLLNGEDSAIIEGFPLKVANIRVRMVGERIDTHGQWIDYKGSEFIVFNDKGPTDKFGALRTEFTNTSRRADFRNLHFEAMVTTVWNEDPSVVLLDIIKDKIDHAKSP